MSMFEDITRLLSGGSALESLSGFIGEDQATTGNAVSAAVPALMGGLSKRTSTADGASALFGMVQGNDGSVLDNIGGFLGSDDKGLGQGLVGSILGGRSNAIIQAVADRSGLGIGGVAKLLPALAPMVMGFLGRKQSNEGLDQAGLMSQIAGERNAMEAGGLGGLLSAFDGGDDAADNAGFLSGLGKLANLGAGSISGGAAAAAAGTAAVGGVAAAAASRSNVDRGSVDKPAGWVEREATTQKAAAAPTTTRREVYHEPEKKKGMWWLWPLLGLVALAILIPLLLTQCGGDDDADVETDTAPVSTTEAMEEEVAETSAPTTEAMEEEPPATTEAMEEVADGYVPGRILDTADGTGSFGVLLGAVDAAGLTETLEGDGPFTVFAPTDEAFADVPEEIVNDPELLAQVLQYHVVAGEVTGGDLADGPVDTVGGESVTIATEGPTVNGAAIVSADILADNGVIHVIDQVLLPPSIRAQSGESLNSILDLEPINFEVGSAVITSEGQAVLDGAVAFLEANPIPVSIEGHTDADGSDEANLALSQARAESVMAYLVENGIDGSLLTAKGFGEANPVADNDTPEGKAENRRIEFNTAG